MKKTLAYRFICLAFAILIGHSLVAHAHQSWDQGHRLSVSLRHSSLFSDLMASFYSLDLGSHHLEDFQIANDFDFPNDFFLPAIDFEFYSIIPSIDKHFLSDHYFNLFLFSLQTSLRAPPNNPSIRLLAKI
jgi:hypothetical protein